MLENATKAQRLRTTLGVFDRSKFFFNLPAQLLEYMQAVGALELYLIPFYQHGIGTV